MAHFKDLKKEAVKEHLRSRNDRPSEEDTSLNNFLTHTQTDTLVCLDGLPRAMTQTDITKQKSSFSSSAKRLTDAGWNSYLFSAKWPKNKRVTFTNMPTSQQNRDLVVDYDITQHCFFHYFFAECSCITEPTIPGCQLSFFGWQGSDPTGYVTTTC